MARLTSNTAFLETNLPPLPPDARAHEIRIVENRIVTLSYTSEEPASPSLVASLFGGASLSVSESTLDISDNSLNGDGEVTVLNLPDGIELTTVSGLSELVLTTVSGSGIDTQGDGKENAGADDGLTLVQVPVLEDGLTLTSVGDISTGGTGSDTGVIVAAALDDGPTPAGSDAQSTGLSGTGSGDGASAADVQITLIGEDLFADGNTGTVTEIRFTTAGCTSCEPTGALPAPEGGRSELIYSELSLDLADVFQFLETTEGARSDELQAVLLAGDDRIEGSAEDDVIDGLAGDDTLEGGLGHDTLTASDGADLFDGGDGFDTVTYAAASGRVFADMLGHLENAGAAAGDRFADVEGLIGGRFGDHLRGSLGADLLRGGNASDRLLGRNGDDTLQGELGNDALYGLNGVDTMTGGEGRDRFIYFSQRDSGVGAGQRDVITDFSADLGERIELGRLDADLTRTFNQAFEFIGTEAFSAIGQIRVDLSSGVSTIVQLDNDGDGRADMEIELLGIHDLTEANFLL